MYAAYANDKNEMQPPRYVHNRNGTVLNDVMPSSAKFHNF
jgi:hypothetical protein